MSYIAEGIKKLRAVGAQQSSANQAVDLYRGMKNLAVNDEFVEGGGSEAAPMSTTPDPAIAVAYGQSSNALLFKIVAKSFMSCGADIQFLSAFPGEKEFLYPPLTYLHPSGRHETITIQPDATDAAGQASPPHSSRSCTRPRAIRSASWPPPSSLPLTCDSASERVRVRE